ncbi:GrlR family regulatory protein [Bradyrhizobium sp. LHD-71]|uniref:GrlR family regulatory protein n=1 Tax=Bradyrhizobium sp. LHD-71 TaxID=3072141 RepID=UPI00280F3BE2|nr:GrlR family regulatory protein [Bradyrhizobium sp. LHD-71]MDQ8729103.1 GrlR family regulatory protein [Bradyrhizobium sp. LHD-71]
MKEGLYKCVYTVGGAVGRSVLYVHGGQMLGGNSAFAHFGTYIIREGEIIVEIETRRHNEDPNYPAMLGRDVGLINVKGKFIDGRYCFEGTTPQIPGAVFRSQMWAIDSEAAHAPGAVGEGGIANGLFSIHIRTLDGIDGGLTGVMLLHDGRILGGDAFFYYVGTYTSANGRWKGEMLNQEHTPSKGEIPVFGGYEVGIGFSGTCDDHEAELQATAFTGKRSLRLAAALQLIRKA